MATKRKTAAAPKKKATTKKRAPRKKKSAAPQRTRGRVVDGILHLEPEDLVALELGHARLVAATQSETAAKAKIGELVAAAKIRDQFMALDAQRAKYAKEVRERSRDLDVLRDRLSSAYGLDLSLTGYDEDSGKLISDGGSGPPIQAT